MASPGAPVAALLAQVPMFRRVARARLGELALAARTLHAAAGEHVIRRGSALPGLMVVRHGLVKLSVTGDAERVLRLVGAGDTFGEEALFLEQPLPLDATAVAETSLVAVPAQPLLRLFERDRRFARALMASLCQRLRMLVADFEALTVHGARERVAAYLESLAAAGGTAHLPAPKTVIAARLGMTKETLSRLLRAFIDEGLIAVAGRDITLIDRGRLGAAARRAPGGAQAAGDAA